MAWLFFLLVFTNTGRSIFRGNVYSYGYRDGYIQGHSTKADEVSGLGRVHEIKLGFHGYGAAVDPTKPGQTPQGAWIANYFDDDLWEKVQKIHPTQPVRVFYIEKDFQFSGATQYEVLDIVPLPPNGEPMDGLIERAKQLFAEGRRFF